MLVRVGEGCGAGFSFFSKFVFFSSCFTFCFMAWFIHSPFYLARKWCVGRGGASGLVCFLGVGVVF